MPHTEDPSLPFLEHIAAESALFRGAITAAPAGAPVPTCPGWTADDLLWHLGEVQYFWGEIAKRRIAPDGSVEPVEADKPERPATREGLLDFFDAANALLLQSLGALTPETPLWMWSFDRTAGYVRRRQAHEALIHRVDAELTAELPVSPIDCRLATDGVDEALWIMFGVDPQTQPGLVAAPTSAPVSITAVESMQSWTITPTTVTGQDSDGDEWGGAAKFVVADGIDAPAAEFTGTAADLDLWLWGRPQHAPIERQGDSTALRGVQALVAAGIN